MLELINKWNDAVDEWGKKDFVEIRNELVKEWTGKGLRTWQNRIKDFNESNNCNYRIVGSGKYELKIEEGESMQVVEPVEVIEGQTTAIDTVADTTQTTDVKAPVVVDQVVEVDRIIQTSLYLQASKIKKLKMQGLMTDQSMNDIIKKLIDDYLETLN